jgi:hypothetical protein
MVDYAFGSFSFWILGRWDNHLSDGRCLFHGTCNREVCHEFAPYYGLGLHSRPSLVMISPRIIRPILSLL